ncbi:hypothetical protein [uncultured Bacteroides sp.]|uniref:hypothetical protein n=1 Tax=uncultured Bacteroides sp. TaxID=162156 RepID=UPI0025D9E857|nr:hypothetical protein [uncultured Bacteroides sp.]
MEEQIKHVVARLKLLFIGFWLLPVIFIIVGETGGDWVGMYAADVRATYFAETLTILLVAICVPVSLKLFAWVLTRKIDMVSLPEALRLYSFWSKIRMLLLTLPMLVGFAVYYLMLSNKGVLCAFIALTASLFCLPGEGRLRKELHINKEEKV